MPADFGPARDRQRARGIRPLWVLLPGPRVVMVSATRRPDLAEATHYCREGDPAWRPIAALMSRTDEGVSGGQESDDLRPVRGGE